jgi:hypothetical protein
VDNIRILEYPINVPCVCWQKLLHHSNCKKEFIAPHLVVGVSAVQIRRWRLSSGVKNSLCSRTLYTAERVSLARQDVWRIHVLWFSLSSSIRFSSRSQWPRGLRHELCSLARSLGSWVRIPLKAWMSVCFYSVFVLFRVQIQALRWSDPPSKESYQMCIKVKLSLCFN